METVDKAVKDYLYTLLSDENQQRIVTALRVYKGAEKERIEDFNSILDKKITEKQNRYNTLMNNLASGVLPAVVVSDIGIEMNKLKDEIENLKNTESPKDYIVEHITSWLISLRTNPDETAIHLLVERIDIKNKTEFNIQSTLNTVLCKNGCGGWI